VGAYHTRWWNEVVAEVFGGQCALVQTPNGPIPVHTGGRVAKHTVVSGAIGYGGVLASEPLTLAAHRTALEIAASELNAPSGRLVVGPLALSKGETPSQRATVIVPLEPLDDKGCLAREAQRVRSSVRAARRRGVEVRTARPSDLVVIVELVHATQAHRAAAYRTPAGLIAMCLAAPKDRCVSFACTFMGRVIAAGVFIRGFTNAAYLINGWDRQYSDRNANHLLVHEAIMELAAAGDRTIDLGYSHHAGLKRFKLGFGGTLQTVWMVDP
jgi:hypothetical protein